MKGLSVFLTILLLMLANALADHLKRVGALPAEQKPAQHSVISLTAPGHWADAGARLPAHAQP